MKILDINPQVIQFPNRIAINQADSKVSKIIDTAQNICFSQSDSAKQPVLNYNEMALEFADGSMVANTNNFPVSNNFYFGAWVKVPSLTDFAPILVKGTYNVDNEFRFDIYTNLLRFEFYTSANTSIGVTVGSINSIMTVDTWHHIAVQKEGATYRAYIDGKFYGQTINAAALHVANNEPIKIGEWTIIGRLTGNIKNIECYNKVIVPIISTSLGALVFDPKKSVLWYKRYKDDGNKKLFLTSRNLEGADINSASEITSINSEVKGIDDAIRGDVPLTSFYKDLSATNKATLTKQGLKFTTSGQEYGETFCNTTNPVSQRFYTYEPSLLEVTLSTWFMPQSTAVNQYFLSFRVGGGVPIYSAAYNIIWNASQNAGNKFMLYDGVTLHKMDEIYPLNNWVHLCHVKKGDTSYFFVNGILRYVYLDRSGINPSVDSYPYLTFAKHPGTALYSDCLLDDVFVSHTAEIDPTGYSVGQKVFQPPRRKDLTIEEYEGRELVQQAVNNGSAKLYLNSKYTKDSDIDGTTGEITSIKNEVDNATVQLEQLTAVNRPTFTKDGIHTLGIQNLYTYTGNLEEQRALYNIGTSDFYVSMWHKIITIGAAAHECFRLQGDSGGNVGLYPNLSGVRYQIDNVNTLISGLVFGSNWRHVAMCRVNGLIGIFFDGILVASEINTANLTTATVAANLLVQIPRLNVDTGETLSDDLLFTVGDSIIDPTGYSVNDKVFTPPRRSSAQPWLIRNKPNTINL